MNNFSFESESLGKRTVWASFYRWESFRIMVLHKVRKCLPGIQKSWESSRVGHHLTKQSGQKPVKLCARCNRWWCSVNKFIISCNNRIECSTRQQFIFGGVWVLKKEKKSTKFSQRLQSFLQEIFFQGEETGNKANPPDLAPKMKRLRKWRQIIHQGGMTFSCSNCLILQQAISPWYGQSPEWSWKCFIGGWMYDQYVNNAEAMETRFQIRKRTINLLLAQEDL